jgi:hypothetical protein
MEKIEAMLSAAKILNAAELDLLLRRLALIRAEMSPPVPQHAGKQEMKVLVEDMPALSIRARDSGGFRLWLRHSGYGWLAYQIDSRTAAGLASFVAKHTSASEMNAVDLVGNQTGGIQ